METAEHAEHAEGERGEPISGNERETGEQVFGDEDCDMLLVQCAGLFPRIPRIPRFFHAW